MSGTNQFLPFATGGGANTLTPSAYAALATIVSQGFQPGLASSQQANTVWRQATFVAAAVAQIIANQNVNANDDGNLTNFVTNLQNAIANLGSLQASSISTLTTNTVLTASQVGGTILGNSTSTITATLPAANSVTAGKQIEFRNINTGTFNILRAGSDVILVNASTATSEVLGAGDYLILESDGTNSWYALNGTVLLQTAAAVASLLAPYAPLVSPSFSGSPQAPTQAPGDSSTKLATTAFVNPASSLGSSGYQKLPSGLILQWMTVTSFTTTNFPIAFPNNLFNVQATGVNANTTVNVTSSSTSGVYATVYNPGSGNPYNGVPVNIFAIGN